MTAVDFSKPARAAFDHAVALSRVHDAELTVVHWGKIAAIVPANGTTARRVHARVVTGDPTAEISRVAAETGADLILMGVTPRGAIGRRLMGSTAARVMRSAGPPVLAVPQRVDNASGSVRDGARLAVAA